MQRATLCVALVAALCASVAGVRLSSEEEGRLEQAPSGNSDSIAKNKDNIAQNSARLKRMEKAAEANPEEEAKIDANKGNIAKNKARIQKLEAMAKKQLKPVDQATKDAAKVDNIGSNHRVRAHRRAREKHQKASDKVKELSKKLGMHKRRSTNKVLINAEYSKLSQKEREYKRRHRYPAIKNKEGAVKRVYEIMHKTKDPDHTNNKVVKNNVNQANKAKVDKNKKNIAKNRARIEKLESMARKAQEDPH